MSLKKINKNNYCW